MKFKSFEDLINQVKGKSNRVVVPGANNAEALQAIKMADDNGLISHGILIGPIAQVKEMVKAAGLNEAKFEFIDCEDIPTMCKLAVDQILAGKGDFLIKGLVDTKYYMKAILNKEAHLVPEGALLSHFVLFSTPKYKKPFAVTDSAVVIAPTLEQKAKIIQNAVNTMHKLGLEHPKVSCVCPVEKLNEKIPSTVEAATLAQMNAEGKITGCTVEGPYDLYISLSAQKAAEKGITGKQVAGDADILMLPGLGRRQPALQSLGFLWRPYGSGGHLGRADHSGHFAFPRR